MIQLKMAYYKEKKKKHNHQEHRNDYVDKRAASWKIYLYQALEPSHCPYDLNYFLCSTFKITKYKLHCVPTINFHLMLKKTH